MRKMRKAIKIAGLLILVVAVASIILFKKQASDYKAFERVMNERPQSYRDLETLVKEHIFDYSENNKKSYLGELEPISNDEGERFRTGRQEIVYYGAKNGADVSYSCSVHTFKEDRILFWTVQSLPQNHTVYFGEDLRIIGYASNWLTN